MEYLYSQPSASKSYVLRQTRFGNMDHPHVSDEPGVLHVNITTHSVTPYVIILYTCSYTVLKM
jgi:hypothetical protein